MRPPWASLVLKACSSIRALLLVLTHCSRPSLPHKHMDRHRIDRNACVNVIRLKQMIANVKCLRRRGVATRNSWRLAVCLRSELPTLNFFSRHYARFYCRDRKTSRTYGTEIIIHFSSNLASSKWRVFFLSQRNYGFTIFCRNVGPSPICAIFAWSVGARMPS